MKELHYEFVHQVLQFSLSSGTYPCMGSANQIGLPGILHFQQMSAGPKLPPPPLDEHCCIQPVCHPQSLCSLQAPDSLDGLCSSFCLNSGAILSPPPLEQHCCIQPLFPPESLCSLIAPDLLYGLSSFCSSCLSKS